MKHRSAIIGANTRRADGHAAAYAHVRSARLVAASARTPGVAEAFADRWRIPEFFSDHRVMLERVAPNIVHVNTPPNARREILLDCDEAGVEGIVLEKPLGVDTDDYVWLQSFASSTKMRIAVNHQLHYHAARRRVARMISEGQIGQVRLIEGSARHLLGYQGTHVLEGILDLGGGRPVEWLAASVWGRSGLSDPGGHISPNDVISFISMGDVIGEFRCGEEAAPAVLDTRATQRHHHKRIAALGDEGSIEWTMWGTRLHTRGKEYVVLHDYDREDSLAQAALVDALSEWLDGGPRMSVAIEPSLMEFRLVLAMYQSAIDQRVVGAGESPQDDIIARLVQVIGDSPRIP